MVTRKPVGPSVNTASAAAASKGSANPPYPTTPPAAESAKSTASSNSVYSADLAKSPAFDLIDVSQAAQQQRARSDSDASSHGTWDSDDTMYQDYDTLDEVEVPKPLNVQSSQTNLDGEAKEGEEKKGLLPESLRIGGGASLKPTKSAEGHKYEEEAQANPWAEQNSNRSSPNGQLDSNNPYLQHNGPVVENSQSEWQEVKAPPVPTGAPPPIPSAAPPSPPPPDPWAAPVELPTSTSPPVKSPSALLSEMSLEEDRPASWETVERLPVPQQGQAPFPPVTGENRALSTWWQDPAPSTSLNERMQSPSSPQAPPYPSSPRPQEYASPPGPPPNRAGTLIDHEDAPTRSSRPAPISTSQPSATTSTPVPETPQTQLRRQRNEHYQIKHLNWLDGSNPGSKPILRQSPILTQNANGPCPLLALVNALVLSTPQKLDTALIETLRSREEVSLGLLLDAVFEELMSGRRSSPDRELPDVGELYSFLIALHTGMNVNPRFVTPTSTPRGSLDGHPAALGSVHPMHRAQRKAGAFEETKEMRLYSTFNIPLIHGWTAPADTPAYEAFVRSAQTFEDAQNIQLAEAELEDKLRSGGLTPQEQQTLQDIQTIKSFLNTWPTQLTDFGLQTIAESLSPGQFAILFRNDHFSTIYKEPRHGALMTLVTDAGYSTHDEIVWESLVDVTGAASELFSGDFRVVSHNQDVRLDQGNSAGGQNGWQTVPIRNQRNTGAPGRLASPTSNATPPSLPGPRPNLTPEIAVLQSGGTLGVSDAELQRKASEQEDHDLALALQLQEEEEAQQREVEQRQRRERELSEQFLSNENEGPRPPVPPRRSAGRSGSGPTTAAASGGGPTPRPAVTRSSDNNDPDAPPSYEQAASDRPYRPAGSTAPANLAQGNPLGAYDALRRQQSAYAQTSSTNVSSPVGAGPASPGYAAGHNRRQSNANRLNRRTSQVGGPPMPGSYVNQAANRQSVNQAPGVKDADDRCVVM